MTTEPDHDELQSKLALDAIHRTKLPHGVSIICFSVWLHIIASLAQVILPYFTNNARDVVQTGLLWADGSLFVAALLYGIGILCCLTLPQQMPGRNALEITGFITLLALAADVTRLVVRLPPLIFWSTLLLNTATSVSFIFFMKVIASYIKDRALLYQINNLLGLGVLILVILGFSILLMIVIPPMGTMLLILDVVLVLVGFLLFVQSLHALKATLSCH